MIIPQDDSLSVDDKLKEIIDYSNVFSNLRQSNAVKNDELDRLRSGSSNIQNQLNIVNNNIQNMEKEIILLKENIQRCKEKQKHEELSHQRKIQTASAQLHAFHIETEQLAEFLGLDLDSVLVSNNHIKLAFRDPQRTTLILEERQGQLKLASMSPSPSNFENIQRQLQETGDLFGMIISLGTRMCPSP